MRLKLMIIVALLALAIPVGIFLRNGWYLGQIYSAIGTMRTLVGAEQKYAEANPQLGYTCSLSLLPIEDLPPDFSRSGKPNEYVFELSGCLPAGGKSGNSKFKLVGRPLIKHLPAYCSDESGIVRYDNRGSVEKWFVSGPLWEAESHASPRLRLRVSSTRSRASRILPARRRA